MHSVPTCCVTVLRDRCVQIPIQRPSEVHEIVDQCFTVVHMHSYTWQLCVKDGTALTLVDT